jgi:hypothetical protein
LFSSFTIQFIPGFQGKAPGEDAEGFAGEISVVKALGAENLPPLYRKQTPPQHLSKESSKMIS